MAIDAKFEDAYSKPKKLEAVDLEDLQVISMLCQDSIVAGPDITWQVGKRRLTLLLNRFIWEEPSFEPERVRSLLIFNDVKKVSSKAISRDNINNTYSLLALDFSFDDEVSGHFTITFSDQALISIVAECLHVKLQDVTRPYKAPSGHKPKHE